MILARSIGGESIQDVIMSLRTEFNSIFLAVSGTPGVEVWARRSRLPA